MTWERFTLVFASVWSQGMSSRPLLSRTPQPGPVAYHVHFGSFTSLVISAGFDQVAPSSVLLVTQTVRVPLPVPSRILRSVSSPRLCVKSSQTVPAESTTGQGLPTVLGPSSQTTWRCFQVAPPSRLRL